MGPEDYAALVVIYKDQSNPLTKDAYQQYTGILGRMHFNEDSVSLVRLIGDELADRGKNDLLVLALLKAMKDQNVPYRILVSNHGLEFIEGYEDRNNRFRRHRIKEHAPSMGELAKVIFPEDGGALQARNLLPMVKLLI